MRKLPFVLVVMVTVHLDITELAILVTATAAANNNPGQGNDR